MSSSNNSFNAFEQIKCTCSQRDKVTTPDMLQVGRGKRLCVHALPADMGVADFCSFVGAYLPSIREYAPGATRRWADVLHGPAHLQQPGHDGRFLLKLQQQAGAH